MTAPGLLPLFFVLEAVDDAKVVAQDDCLAIKRNLLNPKKPMAQRNYT